MSTQPERDLIIEGEQDYQEWRASLLDTPEKKALYDEISAKSDLWLQFVEAHIHKQANACKHSALK